jgi:hypothetical protein
MAVSMTNYNIRKTRKQLENVVSCGRGEEGETILKQGREYPSFV